MKIQELKSKLKPNMSKDRKREFARRYGVGFCYGCEELASVVLTYDISDKDQKAKRLERYCQDCFDKIVSVSNGKDQTLAVRQKKYQNLNKYV